MTRNVLTTFQAAKLCGVHHRTISRWVRNGELKAFETPGGHIRIYEDDLREFLESARRRAEEKVKKKLRLLVVDDEEAFRDSVVRFLGKEEHFEVREACDGYQAGKLLTQFKPDMVILDLMMPGIDGFAVCRDIRNSRELRHTRILVITGFANKKNISKAYESGADLCLAKPVEMDDLKKEVDKLLHLDKKGDSKSG